MKLLYSIVGFLWTTGALADPSLSVSFENTNQNG